MSWLDEVMDCTEELESPRSFWYWSALATISAIVKDNIWLSRGKAYKLYPNIYVMLLAGSGLKKGPPIGMAKSVTRLVNNTKVIVGRSSIQAILKELAAGQTMPGGKINTKSTGFFVASEFSSSLVEDPAAFNCLTDLYDRHYNEGEWKSLLKSETFTLKDPTLSMLVATNDPHLREFVKEKDVYGGFFGRMFIIKEEEVSRLNSLVDDLEIPLDYHKLAASIKPVSELKGEFKSLAKTDAGQLFHEWYIDFYRMVNKQRIEDKTGTIGRFGDSVLKVAMLISLAEEPKLEISYDAMKMALTQCEKFMESIRKVVLQVKGKALFAEQKALVLHELLERPDHKISREQLIRKYWMHFNSDELNVIMQSLGEAKLVTPHNYGSVLIYEMTQQTADELTKMFSSRKKN